MLLPAKTRALHNGTDDPGAATTVPMPRPRSGENPMLWYRDTKPRFYRPYLIRVLKRTDTVLDFVFLDGATGEDLELSKRSYQISYHDGRYSYSALPSTAPKVEPGSPRSCGLLFISDLYMQGLVRADRESIVVAGDDDDKWPRSAGKLVRPAARPARAQQAARDVAVAAARPAPKRRKRVA
jgi:hypothetical protein